MPLVEKLRDRLPGVERVIEVTPDGARRRRVRSAARRRATPVDRDPAVTPDDVVLVMYSSGTTGHPKGVMLSQAQHARPHRERPRRLGVRGRRRQPRRDAALPRRRVVVRALRRPRRHPQPDDPRPRRRLAGRRDHGGRQPHLPGAGGAGAGAAERRAGGRGVREAQDLHVRRVPDAAAAAAGRDGGLAGDRLHPGVRADRGRRRGHPPDARGPSRRGARATPSGWSPPGSRSPGWS